MCEPGTQNESDYDIHEFCKKVESQIQNDPSLTDTDRNRIIQHITFCDNDPHVIMSMNNEGKLVFGIIDEDKHFHCIGDMDRYIAVFSALMTSGYKNNILHRMKIYNKLTEIKLCPMEDILQVCHNYKYKLVFSSSDMLEDAISNQRIKDFYQYLNNNNIIVFNNYGIQRSYGLSQETLGARDFRITYPKEGGIFSMDLPCVNIFDGFVEKVSYENRKRCLICYEKKKFNTIYECGNCRKRVCKQCFEKTNGVTCSFCRYHIHDHLMKKIVELDIGILCLNIHEIRIENVRV